MLSLYVHTAANSIRSALLRDETDVTRLGRAPEFMLGDNRTIRLYLVESDDTFDASSGAGGYTPTLALAPESPIPSGGTFFIGVGADLTSGTLTSGKRYLVRTFVAGDDFANVGGVNATGSVFVASGTTPTTWTNASVLEEITTDLAHNATAAAVETALNATATLAAAGSVDVVSSSEGVGYEVTWRSPGARSILRPSGRDLTPSSAAAAAEVVAGDGSTQEVQSLRLQTRTLALCDSWTPITNGWEGTLSLSTVEALLALGNRSSVAVLLEVEVAGPSSYRRTYVQQAATLFKDRIDAGTLGEAPAGTIYSAAEVDGLLEGLIDEGSASVSSSGSTSLTWPTGCRHLSFRLAITALASGDPRTFTLPDGTPDGCILDLYVALPATAGGTFTLRRSTGPTTLDTFTLDGSGDDVAYRLTSRGGVWVLDSALYPA
jgi:hypothetical protein